MTVCTVRIATVPTAHAPDNKMDACFEEMLCEEIRRCPHLYKSSLKEYKGSQLALNSWRVCVQYNNRMKKLNFPLQDQVDYRTVLNCNLMSLFAPPSRHRGHSVRTSTLWVMAISSGCFLIPQLCKSPEPLCACSIFGKAVIFC